MRIEKKEWNDYFHKEMMDIELSKAEEKGLKEGKLEGIKEGQISMAKSMKNKNMDINLISEITGLSVEEIENL